MLSCFRERLAPVLRSLASQEQAAIANISLLVSPRWVINSTDYFDGYVPFTAIQAFRTAPGVSVVNGAILGNAKVVVLFPPYVLETIE